MIDSGMATAPIKRASQASRVAHILVERIRSGVYAIGTRIPSERVLALEFEVSRPVIREALSTVSALDILDVQMGRGAFVTAAPPAAALVSASNLQDVVNVREILEAGALQLCAEGMDDTRRKDVSEALDRLSLAVGERTETIEPDRALHKAIITASGSALLGSLWEGLEQRIAETIRISPQGHAMSGTILDLHRRLADGVIGGKTADAIAASRELHQQNRDFLYKLLG